MKEYKCIGCGEVKESKERCMCHICGYMMYELPDDRKTVIIREIVQFVNSIIDREIDVAKMNFGELNSDINRFPDYKAIKDHVAKSEKTETFFKRLNHSVDQIYRYFHETFRSTYDSDLLSLKYLSDNTVDFLERVLPELGIRSCKQKQFRLESTYVLPRKSGNRKNRGRTNYCRYSP